jgi:hypothetical protein
MAAADAETSPAESTYDFMRSIYYRTACRDILFAYIYITHRAAAGGRTASKKNA